jgi:aminoacrylate hydrolase
VIGHALGALVGLQLAQDYPRSISALVLVNGWLQLSDHTRRCFHVRERLLQAGGAQAWIEAQPLFLYPADWLEEHARAWRRRKPSRWPIFRASTTCADALTH